jgi:hypothetical protein
VATDQRVQQINAATLRLYADILPRLEQVIALHNRTVGQMAMQYFRTKDPNIHDATADMVTRLDALHTIGDAIKNDTSIPPTMLSQMQQKYPSVFPTEPGDAAATPATQGMSDAAGDAALADPTLSTLSSQSPGQQSTQQQQQPSPQPPPGPRLTPAIPKAPTSQPLPRTPLPGQQGGQGSSS